MLFRAKIYTFLRQRLAHYDYDIDDWFIDDPTIPKFQDFPNIPTYSKGISVTCVINPSSFNGLWTILIGCSVPNNIVDVFKKRKKDLR